MDEKHTANWCNTGMTLEKLVDLVVGVSKPGYEPDAVIRCRPFTKEQVTRGLWKSVSRCFSRSGS